MSEEQNGWTYRVLKRSNSCETWYTIEEVYTIDGKLCWTEDRPLMGDSIEDLRRVLEQALKALDKPVIDAGNPSTTTENE